MAQKNDPEEVTPKETSKETRKDTPKETPKDIVHVLCGNVGELTWRIAELLADPVGKLDQGHKVPKATECETETHCVGTRCDSVSGVGKFNEGSSQPTLGEANPRHSRRGHDGSRPASAW